MAQVNDENRCKYIFFNLLLQHFRRSRVKEPRHLETISAKKGYTSTPLFPTISSYCKVIEKQRPAFAKLSLRSFRPIYRACWPTRGREVLEIASGVGPDLALSEHDTCFLRGTVTLDDVLFTMKIAYISRATLDSESHWTPLDLGTGSIVWAPKRLRRYCGEQSSAYPPATRQWRALT